MTKTYVDVRHAQPACAFGNCTFVEQCFCLSARPLRAKRTLRPSRRQNQRIPSQDRLSDTNPSIGAISESTTPPTLNAKTACQEGVHTH
eukprot:1864092-Amphidinium_carterae.1